MLVAAATRRWAVDELALAETSPDGSDHLRRRCRRHRFPQPPLLHSAPCTTRLRSPLHEAGPPGCKPQDPEAGAAGGEQLKEQGGRRRRRGGAPGPVARRRFPPRAGAVPSAARHSYRPGPERPPPLGIPLGKGGAGGVGSRGGGAAGGNGGQGLLQGPGPVQALSPESPPGAPRLHAAMSPPPPAACTPIQWRPACSRSEHQRRARACAGRRASAGCTPGDTGERQGRAALAVRLPDARCRARRSRYGQSPAADTSA
jgi:hypothetical protein